MAFIVYVLALITFFSTLIGGSIAIKYRKTLQYFFAFAAGSLIGICFFDLLPEALNIANSLSIGSRPILIATVLSFLFYNSLERFLLSHHYHGGNDNEHGHVMGPVGAGSLVFHSFLDGVAIGVAYQVSAAIGIIVALAVIFHDFSDGINTVTLMLKNKQKLGITKLFLFMDALAPVLGVLIVSVISIGEANLAFLLAIFTGEFLFFGASSLMQEVYKHAYWKMTLLMASGIFLILTLTSLII